MVNVINHRTIKPDIYHVYLSKLKLCDSILRMTFLRKNNLIFCVNGLVIIPLVVANEFTMREKWNSY